MKAIMISIKPRHVKNILNGIKTLEIRKRFPSDYVGWVYIYCTKDKKYANLINRGGFLTGMVVARFWCDKVEDLHIKYGLGWETETIKGTKLIEEQTCINRFELYEYCKGKALAIHIDNLEIFDKPKEISDFWGVGKKCKFDNMIDREWYCEYCSKPDCIKELTRAPQSYCFIEI